MFHKAELARLQARKDLLVLQSTANRLILTAEWQRLKSPDYWREAVAETIRRHPMVTTALTALGGLLAVRAVRKPEGLTGGISKLGRIASLAMMVWKLVRRGKQEQ